MSSLNGTSWIELAGNLPNTVAMHLDYNHQSNEIILGTHGRGVFKIDATALIQPNTLYLSTKIFLEGNYSTNSMSTNLNSQGVIPKHQPFNLLPWSYTGSEEVITVPENVVDWVLVELRTGTEKGSAESWRAGFLKNDGLVVDLDGTSDLGFENLTGNKYYVVIYHRNHVSVMSSGLVTLE